MFDKLIGMQLIDLDDNKMIVKNAEGQRFQLDFIEDGGDCCGYNEIKNTLCFHKDCNKINPIITKVKPQDKSGWTGDHVVITLFGMDKELALIDSLSSSGSGWGYGANVRVVCKPLGIDTVITSW